jgi:hypothetical protein
LLYYGVKSSLFWTSITLYGGYHNLVTISFSGWHKNSRGDVPPEELNVAFVPVLHIISRIPIAQNIS